MRDFYFFAILPNKLRAPSIRVFWRMGGKPQNFMDRIIGSPDFSYKEMCFPTHFAKNAKRMGHGAHWAWKRRTYFLFIICSMGDSTCLNPAGI